MAVVLNPYLSFRDTGRAAMEFYKSVFGGELTIMTFADMHASEDPAEQDKVMHAMLKGDNGLVVMGADTPNAMETSANGSVSLSGDDDATLRGFWAALSGSGSVTVPLETAGRHATGRRGFPTDFPVVGWLADN